MTPLYRMALLVLLWVPACFGGNRIIVLDGNGQVFREGEFPKPDSTYPRPTRIKVVNDDGKPLAGIAVQWSVPALRGRWRDGDPLDDGVMQTFTDERGESANSFHAPNYVYLGTSYIQTEARVAAAGVSAPLYFTTVVFQVDGFPNPFPTAQRLSPSGDPPVLAATAGEVVPGAIRYQFSNSSRLGGGAPLANIGLSVSTRNKPDEGPVVECAQAPVVLSDSTGVASCDLKVSGKAGTAAVYLQLGGGYSVGNEPFLLLNVTPASATRLRPTAGDRQTTAPNGMLGQPLSVTLDDGLGNGLPGATIRWDVTQGWATLSQTTTVTDAAGRSSNNLRLGPQSATVIVRATALIGSQPSTTFTVLVADPRSPRLLFRDSTGALGVFDRSVSQVFPGGGSVASDPAGASNSYGYTFITTLDPAGALWLRVFLTDRSWGPWLKAGGEFEGSPAIALNANGTPLIVARTRSGAYLGKTYTGFPGFSSWIQFGGNFVSDPAVTAVGNTYYVAGRDAQGVVHLASYSLGNPVQWTNLGGGFLGKPALAAGPNAPVLAARDSQGAIRIYWATTWTTLPQSWPGDPQLAANSSTTAHVALLDAAGRIASLPLTLGPTALTPGIWSRTDAEFTDFTPLLWNGQLHFFARNRTGDLLTAPAGGTDWANLGLAATIASPPQAARF